MPSGKNRSGPTNTSRAGGVVQLPAIIEPIFKRQQGCAMTGPIFRYNGSNPSARQFPPQVNRKWMIFGCDPAFGFHLVTVDESGEKILEDKKIFGTVSVATLVDLKQGPARRPLISFSYQESPGLGCNFP